MDDTAVLHRINSLAEEEEQLWSRAAEEGGLSTDDDARLQSIQVELDQAYDLSRKLWRQALDAESQGNWAAAVGAFEQIKALPPKAWPNSLDMRMNEAKAKLNGN